MARPLLVVIGPSASGKSSVVRELARRGVLQVHPTWTTRPRPDELAAEIGHRFVTEAEFDELEADGFFLGVVTLPGLPYRDALARLTLSDDGPVDTIMAHAPFVDALRQFFPYQVVYQIEDTPQRARVRLLERGCPPDELAARLGCYAEEARAGRAIAQRAFTNDTSLDDLVDAIATKLHVDTALTTSRSVRSP